MLQRIRHLVASKKSRQPHRTVGETQDYWRQPDEKNDPHLYLGDQESAQKRSRFLVDFVSGFLPKDASVFEPGCNVGRNLSYLHRAGYTSLHGLEINETAVAMFRERFPETAAVTTIHLGPIEELIPALEDRAYDLTYTMAVLEHIHTESEWVFDHLARITGRWLLTIEDEEHRTWRHFPRDYQRIFSGKGFAQVEHAKIGSGSHGMDKGMHLRLFSRSDTE